MIGGSWDLWEEERCGAGELWRWLQVRASDLNADQRPLIPQLLYRKPVMMAIEDRLLCISPYLMIYTSVSGENGHFSINTSISPVTESFRSHWRWRRYGNVQQESAIVRALKRSRTVRCPAGINQRQLKLAIAPRQWLATADLQRHAILTRHLIY